MGTELPLGVTFRNSMPLVAKRIDESTSGGKAGIQEGWAFRRINGQSLDGVSFIDAMAILRKAMEPLGPTDIPPGALAIEFQTSSGLKKIGFTRKPLGMTFDSKMPVLIKKVVDGGHAKEVGVEEGFEIKSIGGRNIDGLDFASVKKLIQS